MVASEASMRTTLEATKQSAKDRTTAAQATAATATTERDSLATRLALAEVEIERLWTTAVTATDTTEKAIATATTAEAAARDATQTAAQEKTVLEAKVAKLERDLAIAGPDLTTTNRQFSEATNWLQVVSEEVTRLREDNSKLSQDLDGEA
jgi:chromosome segregation ATPase